MICDPRVVYVPAVSSKMTKPGAREYVGQDSGVWKWPTNIGQKTKVEYVLTDRRYLF